MSMHTCVLQQQQHTHTYQTNPVFITVAQHVHGTVYHASYTVEVQWKSIIQTDG